MGSVIIGIVNQEHKTVSYRVEVRIDGVRNSEAERLLLQDGEKWKEVPIEYKPRSGKVKLGGWKVGFGNLLHLIKKRIIR